MPTHLPAPNAAAEQTQTHQARTCDVDGCDRAFLARGLCKKHLYRAYRRGLPPADRTAERKTLRERLWDKRVPVESGCIEWAGSTNNRGYGVVLMSKPVRRQWLVHRLVWTLTKGEIPPGMVICHSCDNPLCSNIDHLFLGTLADNSRDMVAKGRMRGGRRAAA